MSTRSYLSIGDVLSLLREEFPDVTISKIRFLESQGLVDPERSPSGYRKFYDHDVERLRWVLRQQRDQFLPLKVIRDRLAAAGNGVPPDEPDETPGPGRGAGDPAGEQKGEVWANGATASPSVGVSEGDSGTGPEAEEHGRGGSVDERYEAQRGNVVRFDAERRQPASIHPASGAHWPVRPGTSPSPTPSVGGSAGAPASAGTPADAQIGANAPGALPGSTELAPARQSASVPAAAAGPGGASGRGDRVDAEMEMRTRTPGLFADVAARGGGAGRKPADVGSAEAVHGGVPGAGGAGRAAGAAGVTPATGAAAMGDRIRDGGERAMRPSGGSPGPNNTEGSANMLTGSISGVSLTLTELSAATGLSVQALATLESFGLIAPMAIAGDTFYDEEALTAAKLVAEFAKFGIEPRHLRLYRNAVDREAGLVEQVITPLLRQRNPESRQRAMDAAAELTRLGQGLRAALVRAELRRQFGG